MGKKSLVSFLKQPYPFYFEGRDLFWVCIVIFLMAVFFNYFMQPFNVYVPEHKMDYFWISVIHSATPIVFIVLTALIFKISPKLAEHWNLGKEFLIIFIILLLTGIGQFLIRDIIYNNPNNWSWHYFFEEIINTCLVGMVFAAILIPINLNRLMLKNQRSASLLDINLHPDASTKNFPVLSISTQLKTDDFTLNPSSFLFAKSEGNYVEVFLIENERLEKLIKRIPIKNLETQLQNIPFIFKTHRSYLVNLKHLEEVSGNAQGYKLKLLGLEETVPVSRHSISSFEKRMKEL